MVIDISENQLLKSILDQASVGIYLLDEQGFLIYANPFLLEMTEYNIDDIRGKHSLSLVTMKETTHIQHELMERLTGKTNVASYFTQILKKNGEPLDIALDVAAIKQESTSVIGVIGFIRDVSGAFQIEKQRQWFESQAFTIEKLNVLGRLAITVVHQINNPLEAIKNYLYLIKGDMDADDERRSMIEKIESEIFRVARLAHQLVEFAVPSGTEFIPLDVHQLITTMLEFMDKHIRCCNVSVKTDFRAQKTEILAVPENLRQAFINIVFNALEAMNNNGKLTIETHNSLATIEIRFIDNGAGISHEIMEKIFEPFFTTKDPKISFGLGLSVTLQIIHAHNGSIHIESDHHGSTVIISLPLAH